MKKGALWLLAAVVIGAAFVMFWRYRIASRGPDVQYRTAPAERRQLVSRITATGTVSALVTVQIGSQVSGRVRELLVDFNSPVKKGQVIARIDPRLYQAQVAQARANRHAAAGGLAKAKVDAANAARSYERAKVLQKNGLAPTADLETAETAAALAAAQVQVAGGALEQARAALEQAEVNLSYTTIVSPIDGVVISRAVDVGQTVAASLQAPVLFTIAQDLGKMQVDTNIAESDVGKLTAGLQAQFTVDAYPGEHFTGTVREVRNAPQTLQNVVTYDAVVDVDNAGLRLKPGMTAKVTVPYARRDDALVVPNAALRFRPPDVAAPPAGPSSDRRTVWVLRASRPEPVPVRVGLNDGSFTEIVEGDLAVGDPVLVDTLGGDSAPPRGGGPARLF